MDDNQKWINEVMSQNVDASIGEDYTRLALNFVFIKILPTSKHQNIKISNIYYTDFPKNITSYFSIIKF